MDPGEEQSGATPLALAYDAFRTSVDHLVKLVGDGGLADGDQVDLVRFMQEFERDRNRLSLVDHGIVRRAEQIDLPGLLCQGSARRVLTSALRISRGGAARRVRAAAAVGPQASMTGEPLEPRRPLLAAAQADGTVTAEQVDIVSRALEQVDRRGFDQADIAAGEQLLTEHALTFGPEDLRMLAAAVVDAIDPDGTLPADRVNEDRRFFHLRPTKDVRGRVPPHRVDGSEAEGPPRPAVEGLSACHHAGRHHDDG